MDKPFQAYRGDDASVFVCYAHEDADIVYPELAWLNDQGIKIWYDEGISAGANWRATIGDALMKADRVLFYVSRESLRSDHCNREINLALDEGKELVPVYLEDVELTSDLKVGLNRVQALHRERDANYRQNILRALGSTGEATAAVGESAIARIGRRRVRLSTALIAGALAIASVLAGVLFSPSQPAETDRTVRRFELELGTTGTLLRSIFTGLLVEAAIAPDGSRIAYITSPDSVYETFYVRDLDRVETRQLNIHTVASPTFSFDGEWLVYYGWFDGAQWLAKVSLATGRSQALAKAFPPIGAAWLPDGTIVFSHNDQGIEYAPADWQGGKRSSLFRVNANGGNAEQLTWVDVDAGEVAHGRPSRLPDGEHLLFDLRVRDDTPAQLERPNVAVLNVRTGDYRTVIENARGGRYAPSGHLVFLRDGGLWAVPFDVASHAVVGKAALIEPSVDGRRFIRQLARRYRRGRICSHRSRRSRHGRAPTTGVGRSPGARANERRPRRAVQVAACVARRQANRVRGWPSTGRGSVDSRHGTARVINPADLHRRHGHHAGVGAGRLTSLLLVGP